MVIRTLVNEILDNYALPLRGIHGVAHWARVLENGRRLCHGLPLVDRTVVELFAVLHDSQRWNEGDDSEHGPRAAEHVEELVERGFIQGLTKVQIHLLKSACYGHTHERRSDSETIQVCWDADRLDLPRVGVTVDPRRLCTPRAIELIEWSRLRAIEGTVPQFVRAEWDIHIE